MAAAAIGDLSTPGGALPSYASGPSATPLLGRHDRRQPATARPPGCRATRRSSTSRRAGAGPTRELTRRRRRARHAAARRGHPAGRPGRDLGAQLPRVGRCCSSRRPRRRRSWSTSTRPIGPASSSTCCTSPASRLLVAAPAAQDVGLRRHDRRGAAALPGPGAGRPPRLAPSWDELAARPRRRSPAATGRGRQRRSRPTTRSTSSTRRARPASPRAPRFSHHNILNNGFFVGELCGYTEEDRVCIPVPFYHCFGMVMGNLGGHHARRRHGDPRPGLRPGRDARGGGAGALHLALRRADDVHRRAGRPGLRRPSTSPACAPGSWPARRARSR